MSSSAFNLDLLTESLQKTRVSSKGVTFAGKSLKLDNEKDAKEVVNEIDKCPELEYLNLEGNTLGVDAAKQIAKSLEKHPEFKRALWKDMFTGRLKEEIPKALQFLGDGLVVAGARLVELDLSDNAFGPIGVKGLASLLRSSSCYALEELRLNNNGLGITGGKLLASALTDCYNCSKKEGKPLALKVFIAGRNRLENEGAKALAEVFKMIGTLEEIAMPQNGIYHVGITALSNAFTYNKNLKILNLNDNTIGAKGAKAIADVLPQLQNLQQINFGDCLLKTKGAVLLANALKNAHLNLEELVLGFNEIKKEGGFQIVAAMANKKKLKVLVLDGNQFGEEGMKKLKNDLKEIGKLNVLGSMDDNESEDEDGDSDEGSDEDVEEEEEEVTEDEDENVKDEKTNYKHHMEQKSFIEKEIDTDVVEIKGSPLKKEVSVQQFLDTPSADNFLALGPDRIELILEESKIKKIPLEDYMKTLMKVSALSNCSKPVVSQSSLKAAEILYRDLFGFAKETGEMSLINNAILVNLGLIKSEDKKFRPTWNLDGCFHALNDALSKNLIPETTKNTLKVFVGKDLENTKDFETIKRQIIRNLG